MTRIEEQDFAREIESAPADYKSMQLTEVIVEANRVYQVIRPALVGVGWLAKLLLNKVAPKFVLGVNRLILTLDNLFAVITVTNF